MPEPQIRFDDGAGYERMMGKWSRLAGEVFLDWLKPPAGLRWIDVGCGNGAFTELLAERCAPAEIQGVDPSEAQLAFARARHARGHRAVPPGRRDGAALCRQQFRCGRDGAGDFLRSRAGTGVAEMARVVRPGGLVVSYAWDIEGGGFPHEPMLAEMRAMGIPPIRPPSFAASRMENLRALWTDAGLDRIETREITVQRTFADFDDFWSAALLGASIKATLSQR